MDSQGKYKPQEQSVADKALEEIENINWNMITPKNEDGKIKQIIKCNLGEIFGLFFDEKTKIPDIADIWMQSFGSQESMFIHCVKELRECNMDINRAKAYILTMMYYVLQTTFKTVEEKQKPANTEKVFEIIQNEINNVDRLIANQEEILQNSDTTKTKAKNDLVYKKKILTDLRNKLQRGV